MKVNGSMSYITAKREFARFVLADLGVDCVIEFHRCLWIFSILTLQLELFDCYGR